MSILNTSANSANWSVIFQSSAGKMSGRTLLEIFSHIVFSFTRGVAGHYNPDEPEFTPELFGYNAFERTGREWNSFPVDEMIYQEYSDRQDTTLDYLAAVGFRVRINDASCQMKTKECKKVSHFSKQMLGNDSDHLHLPQFGSHYTLGLPFQSLLLPLQAYFTV